MKSLRNSPITAAAVLFAAGAIACFALPGNQPPPTQPTARPQEPTSPELTDANKAFQSQDWPKAVDKYKEAIRLGSGGPLVDFRLGYSLHMLKKYDEALEHHLKAVVINNQPIRIDALYNAACAHALLGHKSDALRYFQLAVDAGFKDAKQLAGDTDVDSLRDDETFKKIAEGMGKTPRLGQQLDFLLGSWNATNETGETTESLSFARPLPASQGIVTTMTNSNGSSWTGLMAPMPAERKWSWTMSDALGTRLELVGEAIDAANLQFTGRQVSPVGPGIHLRLTISPGSNNPTIKAEVSEDGMSWRTHHTNTLGRADTPKPDK